MIEVPLQTTNFVSYSGAFGENKFTFLKKESEPKAFNTGGLKKHGSSWVSGSIRSSSDNPIYERLYRSNSNSLDSKYLLKLMILGS